MQIVLHPDRFKDPGSPETGEAAIEQKLRQLRDVLRETVAGEGPEVPVLFEIHEQGKIFTVDCNGTRVKAIADLKERVGRILGDDDCCSLKGPRRLVPIVAETSAEIPILPRQEGEAVELEMVN